MMLLLAVNAEFRSFLQTAAFEHDTPYEWTITFKKEHFHKAILSYLCDNCEVKDVLTALSQHLLGQNGIDVGNKLQHRIQDCKTVAQCSGIQNLNVTCLHNITNVWCIYNAKENDTKKIAKN
ncbi:hypothetical protein T10_1491 [Trichinella papuae]|uniref:Uncharacterized protein n=1 Tax=Trichinella papuae TaxID=268474 RepID=A0A0V1MBB4_9BILA|nr:hypothetical protein T10_1491 [Trichinella papuae]